MRPVSRFFTKLEDDFIRSNYLTMSSRDIGSHLGRGEKSISDRLAGLGLRRHKTTRFSPAEDEVILSSKGRSSVDVAKQLGRDPAVVRLRARKLGIPSWKEWSGGLKEFRGYKVSKIERGDGGLARRVPEHRIVVERHIGRSLGDSERVHHINFNKRDNRIENLHLCKSTSEHSRAHHSINAIIPELLERGIVNFNSTEGIYELCEIHK